MKNNYMFCLIDNSFRRYMCKRRAWLNTGSLENPPRTNLLFIPVRDGVH